MSKVALLLSASRQPYRRGGMAIGPKNAPTRILPEDVIVPANLLSILRDPVVTITVETAGDDGTTFEKLVGAMRVQAIADVEAGIAASASSIGDAGMEQLVEQLLGTETELQPASGAEGETGGVATPSGDPAASSGEAIASATSANSPGTETSSAEGSGQSREKADASEGGTTAGADEGKQPEETSRPPVAEPNDGPSAAPTAKPAGKAKPAKGATPEKA